MANTWNKAGTTWGYNSWESDTVTVSLTGVSATSSIGSVTAFNEVGWGSDQWGVENWGESGLTIVPTGVSATTSVGTFPYAQSTSGWGRTEYGNAGWGVTYSAALTGLGLTSSLGEAGVQLLVPITAPTGLTSYLGTPTTEITVPITAPSTLTSSVGAPTYVGTNAGWGRDTWGAEPWGDTLDPVITLTGVSITSSVGTLSAFNEQGWGRDGWGDEDWGDSAHTVIPTGVSMTSSVGAISPLEMSVGLTGQYATSAVGTPGLAFGVSTEPISGVSATASTGSLLIEIGVPLTGVSATSAAGALSPDDMAIGLTGVSATAYVGAPTITETQIFTPAGVAATSSVGSVVIETIYILTGVSATASTGALSPADVVGITGVSATVSLGSGGVSPLHYKDVDITGYTAYTDIEHSA